MPVSPLLTDLPLDRVLDATDVAVYITSPDRVITYWSDSAERITGWSAREVVGRSCADNILVHVDKDGHPLCGKEFCPLYRCMQTGAQSTEGLLIFARNRDGVRVPVETRVAPIRDEQGQIVGGIETFRDFTHEFRDMRSAQTIQRNALQVDLPPDPRLTVRTKYVPHGIVGGDYMAIAPVGADAYAFLVADIMGHGVSAALHSMQMHSLWLQYRDLLSRPVEFVEAVNRRLCGLVGSGDSFAAAMVGHIDLAGMRLTLVPAGAPVPVLARDGHVSVLPGDLGGLPLGIMEGAPYGHVSFDLKPGDRVLCFTDGAAEVPGPDGHLLGIEGLLTALGGAGFAEGRHSLDDIETRLLRACGTIRLPDDLTLMEIVLT